MRTLKRDAGSLVVIAGTLMLVHLVLIFWMVTLSFHPFGFTVTWFDFAAPIGVGGVWLGTFLALLKRAPLMPAHDPRMEGEMQYGTR